MEGHNYDNRAAVKGWEGYFTKWRRRSKSVRSRAGAVLDVSYGRHPRERIDWFPANAPTSTLVFVHGGYWQWHSKEDFTFLAEPWLETGADVAVLGYPLAPEATVAQITESVKRGVAFVGEKSQGQLVMMGWGSGAQLAAQAGAGADKVIGLSGVYDLHPLLVTSINDEAKMTPEIASRCSPVLSPPRARCLVGLGADERVALRQQSEVYFKAVQALGVPAVFYEWPGLNHYSILDECALTNGMVFKDLENFVFS